MPYPFPLPPYRDSRGDSAREARALRDRQAAFADQLDRAEQPPPATTARALMKTYQQVTYPTAADTYYACNICIDTDPEVEGGTGTPVCDETTTYYVDLLRANTPVGSLLVAYAVGNRWVARSGSTPPPAPLCAWFCGVEVAFTGGGGGSFAQAIAVVVSGGVIDSVTMIFGGSGFTSAPDVGFVGTPGSGATAVATIGGGVVLGTTVGGPGSGYTAVPPVTFGAPLTGGTTATGTAVLAGGAVEAINIGDNGSGYLVAPNVTVSPPSLAGGTTATATAMLIGGLVSEIDVGSGGSLYTTAPTIIVDPPPLGGTTASATCVISTIGVGSITLTDPGSLYATDPGVTIDAPGGGGTTATATVTAVSDIGVTKVTMTAGGSGYVDPAVPEAFSVTITSTGGTFGPYTVPYFSSSYSGYDGCVWMGTFSANFTGSSICAPATDVEVIITIGKPDPGPGEFGVQITVCQTEAGVAGGLCPEGGACDLSILACPGGTACSAVAPFVPMPTCTSRPYSETTVPIDFTEGLASSSNAWGAWELFGGECDPDPDDECTTSFYLTVSEL